MAKQAGKMTTAVATQESVAENLGDVLRRKLARIRKPSAFLEQRYGWGSRKARGVYRGELAPTASDLLNLMAADDDVFERVLELTGRKTEINAQELGQLRAIKQILEGKR